jgi:hypothetical protein
LPSPHPNYKHPYLIPAVKMAITWLLGKAIVSLINRIRKEEYDGGLPFVPMKYGLLLNNFNDKKFCAMPITTFGNSVVDKDLALALRVSKLLLLCLFDCSCCISMNCRISQLAMHLCVCKQTMST